MMVVAVTQQRIATIGLGPWIVSVAEVEEEG